MSDLLRIILAIYLTVGITYGLWTLKGSLAWVETKYPQMNNVGFTKRQKFGIFFLKVNAYGFTTIIHLFVMVCLWWIDIFSKKEVK